MTVEDKSMQTGMDKWVHFLCGTHSPVNLGFDLEQIATEMIFAGSNSLNSAS